MYNYDSNNPLTIEMPSSASPLSKQMLISLGQQDSNMQEQVKLTYVRLVDIDNTAKFNSVSLRFFRFADGNIIVGG